MITLERLFDNSIAQRNFEKLAQAVIDMGSEPGTGAPVQVGIRFGTKAFTWPGATNIQTFTIDHGLGRTPVVVLAVNGNNNTAGLPRTYSYTATQFTLNVIAPSNVTAATADTFHWIAIG